LRACDLLILVDIFCDDKAIACAAEYGADRLSPFLSVGSLNLRSFMSPNPLEVMVGEYGWFEVDEDLLSGKVHLVRLTDFKIICIHKGFYLEVNHLDTYYDVPAIEHSLKARLHAYTGSWFGSIPTSLTSRIGDYSDQCIGIFSELNNFDVHLPRSPYHFGHDYTISQHREYIRSNGGADNDLPFSDFLDFRESIWTDAASKPNLLKFFKQAEEVESINGKFYGTMCEPSEQCVQLHVYFNSVGVDRHEMPTLSELSNWGMTFLHLLEDLFEHDAILS